MGRQALIVAVLLAAFAPWGATAQEASLPAAEMRPLYEHEPYDRLTLNDKERTTLRLVPLPAVERDPNRKRNAADLLSVRLFDRPEEPYEVVWSDVAELRFFEQLVLDEATQAVRDGRFAAAFDVLLHLRREHPKLPGLEEAEQELLLAEARALLTEDRPEDAQVRIVRLYARNQLHPQLADLAASVTERLLQTYAKSPRPAAARPTVARFASQFPRHPLVPKLQELLATESARRLAAATTALDERRFIAAQQEAAAAAMLAVEPGSALELLRRAVEAYPTVTVGVVETSADGSPLTSWSVRRTARLRRWPILEAAVSTGSPPTATYLASGHWTADERDPLAYRLQSAERYGVATAAEVAAQLLAFPTTPELELNVVDPRNLEMRLARPHPRFEAVVAAACDDAPLGAATRSPYVADEMTPDLKRYVRAAEVASGPAEIVERRFDDEEATYAALLAGEVDVVDRLAPWHVVRAAARRELQVVRYAAVGVHLLTFGPGPLTDRPEFRRAAAYAVDREAILRNHLLPPSDDLGSRRCEGLFPQGRTADDPLGYAYDLTVPAQTYDPQRAYLLAALARAAVPEDDRGTPSRPLVLVHPPTATAARACRRIATYLYTIGLTVAVQPASAERATGDLNYVVVTSLEPLVDAPQLLPLLGLTPAAASTGFDQALARLTTAETFAAARSALFDLHRIVRETTPVVPLWQLSEYAAARSRVKTVPAGRAPTSLYQYVDQWRIEPRYNEPLP